MDFHLIEWLNLSVRWFHLIAGIAWIGSSFYFMWLDANIEKPDVSRPGVEGDLWMVHSGGFYQVEKRLIGPGGMPKTLHWFKWEAALTAISGLFLLGVVYYLSGGVLLLDPNRSGLGLGGAVCLSLGVIFVSWQIYDLLWASAWAEKNAGVATGLSFAGLFGIVYGLCQVYSGRGAFIHVGAVLGVIMVANVWARILPCQQKMIDATKAGQKPDFSLGMKAKRRSVHNSYVTFPVIFMMVSNHFSMTYAARYNWLVLILMIFVGAGIRHIMIKRMRGGNGYALVAPVILAIGAVIYLCGSGGSDPAAAASAANEAPVRMAEIQAVTQRRCVACHSTAPTDDVFKTPPNGVKFETPQQIKAMAGGIKFRVVETKTMPLANKTGMTDDERALLGRWIEQGAPLD